MSAKKINKTYIWIFICIAVAGLTFSYFAHTHERLKTGTDSVVQVRPVKYMVVKEYSRQNARTFPGLVREAGETRLAFRVGGTLQKLDVVKGQRVKKGDTLAVIDPRDYNINLARLKASLEEANASFAAMAAGAREEDIASLSAQVTAAKANLEQSRKNWERLERLVKENFVSRSQYDAATADLSAVQARHDAAVQELKKARTGARAEDIAAAKARIKQLKASIKAAEYALGDTVLRAPFDGIINQKPVENFEAVAPGQHIVSLLDFSTVDVHTDIPEEMVLKRKSFNKIAVVLDAYPRRIFQSTIKELGLKTDQANQSFPLAVSLSMPADLDIQPGMTASIMITYSDNKPDSSRNIMIPATAVFSNEKGDVCTWKIDTETLTLSEVKVTVKGIHGDFITVTNGLTDGDHIVTAGARFLTRHQKIKLIQTHGNSAS